MRIDFEDIIRLAGKKDRKKLVITGQMDPAALSAVLKAREKGWVEPIACGDAFIDMDSEMKVLFSSVNIEEARQEALSLVQGGKADILLDTGPLAAGFFSLLTDKIGGINGGQVLSYVNILTAPKDGRMIMLTDTLINGTPCLKDKVCIVENVIDVAKTIGIDQPNIAALAPLELVNPALESTLDAAILSKMSERGQFGRAVIEGPLAMDNAESAEAARHKGINSSVPGDVDIYFFPDLESANLTAQFLAWVGRCQLCGVLAGTAVPVVIRSPLESPDSWFVNLAMGLLF
jgi:phosphate butyryltransferase